MGSAITQLKTQQELITEKNQIIIQIKKIEAPFNEQIRLLNESLQTLSGNEAKNARIDQLVPLCRQKDAAIMASKNEEKTVNKKLQAAFGLTPSAPSLSHIPVTTTATTFDAGAAPNTVEELRKRAHLIEEESTNNQKSLQSRIHYVKQPPLFVHSAIDNSTHLSNQPISSPPLPQIVASQAISQQDKETLEQELIAMVGHGGFTVSHDGSSNTYQIIVQINNANMLAPVTSIVGKYNAHKLEKRF